MSIAEPALPSTVELGPDSNVEMSWQVFGGEYQELYEALIVARCLQDELDITPEIINKQFRLHVHRGITYLLASNYIRSLEALLGLAISH